MNLPDKSQLISALVDAGKAHHDYQSNILNGEHDKYWPGWYAAYVLGRLGDFTTPSALTELLASTPSGKDWNISAAEHVRSSLGNQ
ncbi:MAG: hypothetical protein Tsb0034_04990 [Ekhidna sp.]